jgi:hypothetical protein
MSNPAAATQALTTDNGPRTFRHPPIFRQPRTADQALRTVPAVPIFLCVLCWCSHFAHFRQFGFYEDDHYFAAPTMNWTPADAVHWIVENTRHFPEPQGRPVGFVLGGILPWIGWHLGGLPGMYLVGYVIFAVNANLFYFLLRRCLCEPMPVIAAVGFILFPADTTRPFLNHQDILQPAIAFMLGACHLYINRGLPSRILAYVLILLALLSYETAALPFIFFPLLMRRWDLSWLARFGLHGLVIVCLFGSLAGVRGHFGEERASGALADRQKVEHLIRDGTRIGINTVKTICRVRAIQGLNDALSRPRVRRGIVVCGLSVIAATWWAAGCTDRRKNYWMLFPDLARAAAYGVAALSISYVLSFTHYPPDFQVGRMTSTHLAATFPVAVLMAAFASLPMALPPKAWGAVLCGTIAAAYFSLLFRRAQYEQESYAAIWHARQVFWTKVIDLCPDLKDGTLVIVDGGVPRPEYYMDSSSWSDYMVLDQVWDFRGKHFGRNPELFCFRPNPATGGPTWQAGITHQVGGPFLWHHPPEMLQADSPVFSGNTILLHADERGNVTRQTGTIRLAGSDFKLKDPDPAAAEYPRLPMYRILTRR